MSAVYNIAVCCGLWFYCCTSGHACPESCRCSTDPNFPPGELIDCSYLKFTELPGNIPEDTRTALFHGNRLSQVKNFSFAVLNKMLILDLSYNRIHILDEYAFQGLSNLIKLDLSLNCLVSSPDVFPERVFMFLGSLKALNLEYIRYNCFFDSGLLGNSSVVNYFDKSVKVNTQERRQLFSRYNKENSSREQNKLYKNNGKINAPKLNEVPMKIDRLQRNSIRPLPTSTDYPDKALSYLTALNNLSIDLIPNKTLGTGLRNLTLLNFLRFSCDTSNVFYNNLTNETFVNVPHIETLEIRYCEIEMIDVNSFSMLENLSSYDMSLCTYNIERLWVLFQSLTQNKIQILDISGINDNRSSPVTLKSDHLKYFRNLTSLQRLHAVNNNIKGFEKGVLCTCVPKSLKEVYLDRNMLTFRSQYFEEFQCLENLELLSINDFTDWRGILFPFWENDQQGIKRREIFSQTFTNGNTRRLNEIVLPPKLKLLIAKRSGLMSPLMSVLPFHPNNSLQRVYAGQNYFPYWSGFEGLRSLVELHLEDVSCDDINSYFFKNFTSLTVLDISGNQFKNVDKIQFGKTLKNLSMSRTSISSFNDSIFRNLDNLEFLDLSANRIRKFEYNISHMVNLTFLNLSGNQLNTLPKPVCDQLDSISETHHVTVDLTFNPIDYMCANIDFLKWVRDSRVIFLYTDSTCVHVFEGLPQQTEDIFGTIARLERECNSYAGMFFGAAASCLVVLIILGTALAYRFRWKLRYLYYATRLNFKRQSLSDNEDFHFDAFVSFSSENTGFVMGEMKTRLEDDLGLMLCIHTRDFIPGQYIASNILEAIQRSRHTMLVLTRALLESDWCNYELQMALMEGAHTGRDVLLFLLYEDIPNSELPREIIFNIQSHTYLEFPQTEDDRELFWNRLAEAIRG